MIRALQNGFRLPHTEESIGTLPFAQNYANALSESICVNPVIHLPVDPKLLFHFEPLFNMKEAATVFSTAGTLSQVESKEGKKEFSMGDYRKESQGFIAHMRLLATSRGAYLAPTTLFRVDFERSWQIGQFADKALFVNPIDDTDYFTDLAKRIKAACFEASETALSILGAFLPSSWTAEFETELLPPKRMWQVRTVDAASDGLPYWRGFREGMLESAISKLIDADLRVQFLRHLPNFADASLVPQSKDGDPADAVRQARLKIASLAFGATLIPFLETDALFEESLAHPSLRKLVNFLLEQNKLADMWMQADALLKPFRLVTHSFRAAATGLKPSSLLVADFDYKNSLTSLMHCDLLRALMTPRFKANMDVSHLKLLRLPASGSRTPSIASAATELTSWASRVNDKTQTGNGTTTDLAHFIVNRLSLAQTLTGGSVSGQNILRDALSTVQGKLGLVSMAEVRGIPSPVCARQVITTNGFMASLTLHDAAEFALCRVARPRTSLGPPGTLGVNWADEHATVGMIVEMREFVEEMTARGARVDPRDFVLITLSGDALDDDLFRDLGTSPRMWPNTLADWAQFLEITEKEMDTMIQANHIFWRHLFEIPLRSTPSGGVSNEGVRALPGIAVTASVLRAVGHGIRLSPVPCGPLYGLGDSPINREARLRGLVAFQGGEAVSAWDPQDDIFARDTATRLPTTLDLGAEMTFDLTSTQRRTT